MPLPNTTGDRIAVAFDKSMFDPSDKHTQFTVLVDDILKPVINAALNTPDITKIDLTLESSVVQGQVISLSYFAGDVESTEGKHLISFSKQAVVNKVSAPIYNQGGFGFSGLIAPNPLGNGIVMTGYNQWPQGFYKSVLAFAGSIFDGQCMWMIPANADSVVKIDKDTGVMTGYNKWPSGFRKGNLAFAGGVFDGQSVWMIPSYADRVIKIDKDTGEMTGHNQWPAGFIKGEYALAGGVFDGQNIWMIPSYADKVIRLSSFSTMSISANITANDTFYFYISQDETMEGILIGQGSRYSSTYSLNTALIPGVTNYLHIKSTDSMGPIAGFIGDFTLNDDSFSFANGTQRLLTGEDCWVAYTDIFDGTKEKVTTICKNGMGKWATRFGIDLNAQWIWTKGGEDLTTRYFSTPIYYSSAPIVPITDVKVINTIIQADVVVNENSFTKKPYAIEKEKDRTIVEWRFDRISIGQREDISFDVTLEKPVSGEDRLVSHNLEVLYEDAINKQPVRIELGSRFVHVFNAAFFFTLTTDKEVYEMYEDIIISGIIKNLSEYSRTVDMRVVIGDSHGIPVEEVTVMPDLTFAAGEERGIGDIVCNIGTGYSGNCTAYLLLDENQRQVGETSTGFTIKAAPSGGLGVGAEDGVGYREKAKKLQ